MPKTDAEKEHAARVAAELKQTEDLLAGFDRPGRTPRPPAVRPDFVDFHLKRLSDPNARPASAGGAKTPDPKRGSSTVLIRRKQRFPSWGWWAALFVTMPVGGVLVSYCALMRQDDGAPLAASASASPSAATTISAATTPIAQPTTGPERDIPPPPPPSEEEPPGDPPTDPPAMTTATTAMTTATATTATATTARPASHSTPRHRVTAAEASSARPPASAAPSAAPAKAPPPNPDFIRTW